MTWMDSYYRVHSLYLELMDCDDDVRDIIDDVVYILRTVNGVGPIMWAMSAWLAFVSYVGGGYINPKVSRDICVGACKALGLALMGEIEHRLNVLTDYRKDDVDDY